jgi:UDP-N-acetylglucosamine--N-acetylmuramyl-(pentapeptide) pyrophosphoryl-undecaprenol N-acetylglucosamine transferase
MKINRAIISGGGTGGHIFPAIAIADEIKKRNPDVEILFVGAMGRMEMEKVPAAGYAIEGLKIAGFQRKFTLSNLLLPFKIVGSLLKARRIIKSFKPQVVIGVGGYASGPTLKMATWLKVPTVIQEQNSFPGKTNKILAPKVSAICTAYEGLEKFFPKNKITITGNPVRNEMVQIAGKKEAAATHFNLSLDKPVVLVIGGSLGARTLNETILNHYDEISTSDFQLIWQCGKTNYESIHEKIESKACNSIKLLKFIDRMDYAYALADIIVSRSGAIAVSELSLVAKPTILVPSPNVAEDHQTKNAMALVSKNAAVLVKDVEAQNQLIDEVKALIYNLDKQKELSAELVSLAKPNATEDIVDIIENILSKND